MNSFKIVFLLFISLTFFTYSTPPVVGTIVIEFPDISPNKGVVEASIYSESETFLVKDQFIEKKRAEIIDGKSQIIFHNIPFGKVAVGSYHDIDADKTYDKNFIGLPVEPYAFSKKPTCNWRKPRFEEVAVDFVENGQVLKMEFQRFME